MRTQLVGAAVAALTLLPGTLPAQERSYVFTMGNGRIGVMVDMLPHEDTDRYGARIESVMDDSPAAKAGLKSGDIITKFNGTSLGGLKADRDRSGPGAKLMDLSAKVDVGDEVRVEYRREGKTQTATITAENLAGRAFMQLGPGGTSRWFGGRMPEDLLPSLRFGGPGGESWGDLRLAFGGRWGDMELVSLSPDLGEYFGTTEGVLVVKAPSDSTLALKAGDVIQAIDGRAVQSPEHAFRIIRSYTGGETAQIQVLRKRNRVTVGWTVPEQRHELRRMERPGGMRMAPSRKPGKREA